MRERLLFCSVIPPVSVGQWKRGEETLRDERKIRREKKIKWQVRDYRKH